MQLEKVGYDNSWRNHWEDFVRTSTNGNFLHSRAFYDHNPRNAEQDSSLLFLKKNKVISVFPAILTEHAGQRVLNSHGRSTYGGIIVNEKVGVEEAVEMVDMIIAHGKELQVSEIVVRNPFRIFYRTLSDEADYAMWYRGFELLGREVEVYVDLRPGIDAVRKRYENGTKYNVKKAWKYVTVRESTDLEDYWAILEENLMTKFGQKPVHSITDIRFLIDQVGADNIKFFGAYHEGKLAGGCLVFVCAGKSLHAQYIGQDSLFQEFRPINAVIDFILEWGAERGFDYFNLGKANEDGGRVINSGLFHFKGGFGGRGVLRETMHLTL